MKNIYLVIDGRRMRANIRKFNSICHLGWGLKIGFDFEMHFPGLSLLSFLLDSDGFYVSKMFGITERGFFLTKIKKCFFLYPLYKLTCTDSFSSTCRENLIRTESIRPKFTTQYFLNVGKNTKE